MDGFGPLALLLVMSIVHASGFTDYGLGVNRCLNPPVASYRKSFTVLLSLRGAALAVEPSHTVLPITPR